MKLNVGYYESRQIYVELERARLVRRLAKIKEEQGLVAEAAEFMLIIAYRGLLGMCLEHISFSVTSVNTIINTCISISFLLDNGNNSGHFSCLNIIHFYTSRPTFKEITESLNIEL